jgi:hypothetical protein
MQRKDAAWVLSQSVWWRDQALFCATFDGIRMEWRRRNAEKRGKRREKTTRLVRLVLRNFWRNRAQNAASLSNFCAQCVALVAFFGHGRTGPWEHSETVFRHDAIGGECGECQRREWVVLLFDSIKFVFPIPYLFAGNL